MDSPTSQARLDSVKLSWDDLVSPRPRFSSYLFYAPTRFRVQRNSVVGRCVGFLSHDTVPAVLGPHGGHFSSLHVDLRWALFRRIVHAIPLLLWVGSLVRRAGEVDALGPRRVAERVGPVVEQGPHSDEPEVRSSRASCADEQPHECQRIEINE